LFGALASRTVFSCQKPFAAKILFSSRVKHFLDLKKGKPTKQYVQVLQGEKSILKFLPMNVGAFFESAR